MGGGPGRESWAGTTLAERRTSRRRRLLDAGTDLLGTAGSAAVTVRAVCRAAGLTERYFYENFADRDELLVAVYEQVADEARRVLAGAVEQVAAGPGAGRDGRPGPATVARAVVEAFVTLIIDDPRRGRILLNEAAAEPALMGSGARAFPSFSALVAEQLAPGGADAAARRMASVGMVGALSHLFMAWLDGSLRTSRSRLVDHAVKVVLAHAALGEGEAPTRR